MPARKTTKTQAKPKTLSLKDSTKAVKGGALNAYLKLK